MSLKLTRVINGKRVEVHTSFMQGFSESYLADIGRIIGAWSHCEFVFHIIFLSRVAMKGAPSGSTKHPEVVKLMGLSLDRQVRAFREHIEVKKAPQAYVEHAHKLLERVIQLRSERDEIAHSAFQGSFRGDEQLGNVAIGVYKSWKNTKEIEFNEVTQESLKKSFEKMHALYWDLNDFLIDPKLRTHL